METQPAYCHRLLAHYSRPPTRPRLGLHPITLPFRAWRLHAQCWSLQWHMRSRSAFKNPICPKKKKSEKKKRGCVPFFLIWTLWSFHQMIANISVSCWRVCRQFMPKVMWSCGTPKNWSNFYHSWASLYPAPSRTRMSYTVYWQRYIGTLDEWIDPF